MTLPDFLQPDSPFRPWAILLGTCLLACLPRASRRLGGILLFVVAGVAGVNFFLTNVFASYLPGK